MNTNSDYLNLSFNGDPWFVHPPLYFWLSSAITKLVGFSPAILRFQEALFSTGVIIITYLIAKLLFNPIIALRASLILVSSLYIIIIGKLAIFDTHLHFFTLLSLYLILYVIITNRQHWLFITAGIATALGILSKGPIALVHQLIILLPFIAIIRQWTLFKSVWLWLGLLVSLLIPSPWYIHQLVHHGQAFFDMALKDYTWYRFFGVVESQTGPWYFYFIVLCAFFPWVAFIPSLSWSTLTKKITIEPSHRNGILFSWIAIIITFLFFSVAQTKLPNYIYLIFPFASMVIAHWISQITSKKTLIIAPALMSIAIAIIGINIQLYDLTSTDASLFKITFLLLIVPVIGYALSIWKHHKLQTTLLIYWCGTLCVFIWLTYIIFPNISNYDDMKRAATIISKDSQSSHYEMIHYRGFKPSLMVYLNKVLKLPNSPEELNKLSINQTHYILYRTNEAPKNWLSNQPITKTWALPNHQLEKLSPMQQNNILINRDRFKQ